MNLYHIPKDELLETMRASYNENHQLHKITATIKQKETLLYIHYTDDENARQEIKEFAIQNADYIVEKICTCTDKVARLFLEYFYDGQAVDFHAKIATKEQIEALNKAYDKDNPGDYPSDMIFGDTELLKVMILCTDNDKYLHFQYAVDIMAERIQEKPSADFKKLMILNSYV